MMLNSRAVGFAVALLMIASLAVQAQAQAPTAALATASTPAANARLGDGVAFYVYRISGRSADDIREEAMQRALASTIGTLYYEDRFIVAPELLEAYLQKRFRQFIAGVKVVDLKQGVGNVFGEVQVAVDRNGLERDLTEKRFFYKPKTRPYFHISLAETVDGTASATGDGRDEVANALREMLARPTPYKIDNPPPTLDVEANPDLLNQALVAARRQGIEIILTGSVTAKEERRERLYFNDYIFYDSEVRLKLIRVQNGEVLREVKLTGRGSDKDAKAAAAMAVRRASGDATRQILEGFFDDWRRFSLDEANYRILVQDVDKQQVEAFISRLSGLTDVTEPDEAGGAEVEKRAKVYLKNFVNGVAVLNVYYEGDRARLVRVIEESRYPQFTVNLSKGKHIKLSRISR